MSTLLLGQIKSILRRLIDISILSAAPPAINDLKPRDLDYYRVPLVILVEATLFKVPRVYFDRSDVFRKTYLSGPTGKEEHTDQQPLRLDGVAAAEFRWLLKAMIQGNVDDMPWIAWISVLKLSLMWKMKIIHDLAIQKIETRINNTDEWITIFKISTRLRIEKLRDLAIRTLRPRELDPLKRIELATEYGLELPWLLDEFVTRKKAISVEEEEQLGWNITAKLFRERHRQLEQEIEDEYYDIKSDIRTVVGRDNIGAKFDNSLISFLRPELLTATDSSIIQRDETYYLVDVILSVEDTLFKLPRCMFEESSDIFRDMFLFLPQDVSSDGSSDEQPLFLHGVRKGPFRRLLMAMEQCKFPSGADECHLDSEAARILFHEWVSALELSYMWQMTEVRERVIEEISNLFPRVGNQDLIHLLKVSDKLGISEIRDRLIDRLSKSLEPIELIKLGTEFPINSLLVHGYASLAMQKGGISAKHEELLGMKTTSKLFRIRDGYLQKLASAYDWANKDDVMRQVEQLFAEEFLDTSRK